MSREGNIMVVAGEVSGDMHAAALVHALKQKRPEIRFFGIGGDNLRAEGMEILQDAGEMAVMGFAEVVRKVFFFRRVFRRMVAVARERKPDAVILVDYPGFNLRFAGETHALGIKTIYYVCPQVWAWDRSRIPRMATVVDHLLTIFPFEEAHFKGTGLKVSFVGHPLVDAASAALAAPGPALPWNGSPRVAFLPGSRSHVIEKSLAVMWPAAARIEARYPEAGFIIAASHPAAERSIRALLPTLGPGPKKWAVVEGNTRQVLRQATAAVVASGTATVEACLMHCPMVVVYRMAPLSYFVGKCLVKVDHIGMVNIVAGGEICPELIQHKATPQAIARALDPLLSETAERAAMIGRLQQAAAKLGPGGAADRAADHVLETLA